jgi:hypothetical protein
MGSNGRFVWHELMTSDVDAAKAFYTEVIGWKTQPFDGGPKPYTMFCVGEQPIGGVMTLPDEAKAQGAPNHWLGHVYTGDVDATAAKVAGLGGKVLTDVREIPTVGRFAIIQDPQGAVFSAYQPAGDPPGGAGDGNGSISWNELNTTDYEAGWKFYGELFGWKETESMDMGPEHGTYFMFTDAGGDKAMGGMSNAATVLGTPPYWLYYATVDDLDAALERTKSHGGQVLNGPMDVPGGERVAQCMDPQGAAFALHSVK